MQPRSERHAAFGAAIRVARRERSISQEHLALEAGIERAHLGGIERGEENPSLSTVFKIADTLDLRPSEIHARAEVIAANRT